MKWGKKEVCRVGPAKHMADMCLTCASTHLTANNLAGNFFCQREELETPNPSVCRVSRVCRVFFFLFLMCLIVYRVCFVSCVVSSLSVVFFLRAHSAYTGFAMFRVQGTHDKHYGHGSPRFSGNICSTMAFLGFWMVEECVGRATMRTSSEQCKRD
jgi:hypothetical protein